MIEWIMVRLGYKLRWTLRKGLRGRMRITVPRKEAAWAERWVNELGRDGWRILKRPKSFTAWDVFREPSKQTLDESP